MIKDIIEKQQRTLEIDLTGPDGNAYALLAYAKTLAKMLDKDFDEIKKRMTSGDYENLVEVFEEEFGNYVILWRRL
jgi:hypothetical protein